MTLPSGSVQLSFTISITCRPPYREDTLALPVELPRLTISICYPSIISTSKPLLHFPGKAPRDSSMVMKLPLSDNDSKTASEVTKLEHHSPSSLLNLPAELRLKILYDALPTPGQKIEVCKLHRSVLSYACSLSRLKRCSCDHDCD